MIVDNFLTTFGQLKEKSISGEFKDEVNDVDGVTYPLICKDIPDAVKDEIGARLSDFLGRDPMGVTIFMRRSPKGVGCPQKVHSDYSMGLYSMMLYINDEQPNAGTALVKHVRTGIAYNPADEDFVRIVRADENVDSAWEVLDFVSMKPNRAFLFQSDALHRAEPVGGFGEGVGARVVLTCFFS